MSPGTFEFASFESVHDRKNKLRFLTCVCNGRMRYFSFSSWRLFDLKEEAQLNFELLLW